MVYPPLPGSISIPAVVAGNMLQSGDTSVSVNDTGPTGHIVLTTNNTLAMVVNPDQSVSIGTEQTDARLTINNDVVSSTTPTLRLSYQDDSFFDMGITANGNVLFVPSCTDSILDPHLVLSIRKNVNIPDHNGTDTGLMLNGGLVTSTAAQLNYTTVSAGSAQAYKALVLDSNKNVTGVNYLSASTLTGTLTSGPQWGITELDTVNIRTQLSLGGVPFNLSPTALGYLNVTNPGVAQALCALVIDVNRNIVNINRLSASMLTGTLTSGPQPNITSLSALSTLNVYGQTTLGDRLTITNSSGQLIQLAYDGSNYASMSTSSLGELLINSTGGLVSVQNGNFRISEHNGSSSGLILGSQLVTATGTQLNYVSVTPGTAAASKAVVLDSGRNVLGINLIGSTSIAGTLITGGQPNIISVNTLDIANHNGSTTGLSLAGVLVTATALELNYIDTTPGSAQASKAIVLDSNRSISNINSILATTLVGTLATGNQPNISSVNTLSIANHDGATQGLSLGAVLVTSSAVQLNYTNVIPGIGSASKALVLDTSRNISGINLLTASTLAGTLSTGSQPNITSVNTLIIANHNGSTQGLTLGAVLVTTSAVQLNWLNTTPGLAFVNKAMVLDTNKSISGLNSISAANLTGILTTASQINVRILQSINVEDHNGSTTGLSLGGALVTATAAQLNALSVSPGTAVPSGALVLNSSGAIAGIASLSAISLIGTIQTASQPNISTVSNLNISSHDGGTAGLSLGGTLVTVTANQVNKLNVVDGSATASKAMILNSSGSITGINSLAATTLSGTLATASQPNVNSVNNLNVALHNGVATGLSLAGALVTATANQLNQINTIPGVAFASKAVVLDSNSNFTGINSLGATTLTGTLATTSQPNLRTVSVLNVAGHDGGSQGLQLGGALVVSTANQINYTAVVPGVSTSERALVMSSSNSISGINQLSANKIIASQLSLSGVISNFNTNGIVIKTYSMTNLSGRVVDIQLLPTLTFQNFQPAGLTNSFSCEIVGYILPLYSETYTFYINCNDRVRVWINGVLVLHSWLAISGYRASASLFLNANQWAKVYIQYQIDSVNSTVFNMQWASNSQPQGNIPGSSLAWDSNPPANSSNHFSQNSLTIYNTSTTAAEVSTFTVDTSGDLTINAGGNNVTLGSNDNFNIPTHNGLTQGLSLGGVLVLPTAYEINYLKVNPGATTASKALVVDASSSITGLNSVTATSISCTNLTTSAFTISNLSLSGPLNNYNTGSLLIRQFTGPDVSGRLVNVNLITNLSFTGYDPQGLSVNYSLDIIGYVKPIYTELYTFYAIANDRVRIWVNNVLIMNVWNSATGLEYTSTPIQMTANQWVPIYIQFQNLNDVASLSVRWSSTTLTKSFIPVANMAWDNTIARVPAPMTIADSLTLFSSQSGLITVQTGGFAVDNNGNLSLSSSSGSVSIATANNLNIVSHNGTTGLQLSGTLVVATAVEINRIGGVVPGTATANKAALLDSNRSISGISSLSATNLSGTLQTGAQPNITSFGTLTGTFSTTSDILVGSTTLLRLSAGSTTAMISSSVNTTTDSAADLFVGTYGTTTSTSSRKFMLKASGALGIQTNTPNRILAVNAAGATYGMRLINNNAVGAETNYVDLGADSSGSLLISPSGTSTALASNLTLGAASPATLTVTSGVLNITAASGCVQIGNSSNTVLPLEVGSGSFALSGTVGYLNRDGSVGSFSTAPSTYSIRTTSSIIVNGTVCVTSDRRLKDAIEELDIDRCRRFVMNSTPVSFEYKRERGRVHLGLIAQDVARSEFKELVQLAPEKVEASTDNEFDLPADAALNVSYTEIVPILLAAVKDLYRQNAELRDLLDQYKHGL